MFKFQDHSQFCDRFLYTGIFHRIKSVEFVYDSHVETFLSTLYTHASAYVHTRLLRPLLSRSVSFGQQSECQSVKRSTETAAASQFETLDRGASTRETSADASERAISLHGLLKTQPPPTIWETTKSPSSASAHFRPRRFYFGVRSHHQDDKELRESGNSQKRESDSVGSFSLHNLLSVESFLSLINELHALGTQDNGNMTCNIIFVLFNFVNNLRFENSK